MKERISKLINVKSIVTILTTLVFCYLSITQVITPELFMAIFTMIMGFYFGTQNEKKNGNDGETTK